LRLAVTGHRPPKLGGYHQPNEVSLAIRESLRHYLLQHRPDLEMVYVGMALGFDQWVAEDCINLDIPFFACIPFIGYESRWPERSQQHYHELLSRAADQIVVTPVRQYRAWYLQARNQWMVDRSNRLLACWNGIRSGGTWNCIRYAESINKQWVALSVDPAIWERALTIERELALNNAYSPSPEQMQAIQQLHLEQQAAANLATQPPTPIIPVIPPSPGSLQDHAARIQSRSLEGRLIRRRQQNMAPSTSTPAEAERQAIEAARRDMALASERERAAIARERAQRLHDLLGLMEPRQVSELDRMYSPYVIDPDTGENHRAPSQPSEEVKQESKERFKPGRLLELDDD
jgi:uncharacterized phage-like protein YoqJ